MPGLSKTFEEMRPHYDVVVVGSGYGGGVTAARLAEAGRRVCVFEKGREFQLGEFGNTWLHMYNEVQLTGRWLRLGSPAGLFDFRIGDGISVLTGCGLGGGSLINAAVALRADREVLTGKRWPKAVAGDGLLEAGYREAERMLGVAPFSGARDLPKYRALDQGGRLLGATVEPAPVAINFSSRTSEAGIESDACRLCGDCWSGCNVGAKNTIAQTYLPQAVRSGAEVFTLAEVRFVTKADRGWTIHVEDTMPVGGVLKRRQRQVTAETLVLAAGVLGSTEILLRSREHGLALSDRLGKGLSGNGDEMVLGRDLATDVNAVAVGYPPRAEIAPVGPHCSGFIRYVDEEWGGRTIIIQEGSMLPLMAATGPLKALMELRPQRWLKQLLEGPYAGLRARTQVYYVVTDDDAAGEMSLANDRLVVAWPDAPKQECFARIETVMRRMIEGLGGEFLPNPLSQIYLGGRKVTAHALGGCGMGEDARVGVVDDECRVYDSSERDGRSVHEGLYVCDGSVIPSSLGINPLLTIAALSERAMTLLIRRKGWQPSPTGGDAVL